MPAAARAGVYARYSSENQRPESIEDQVRACRVGARQRGFVILEDHVYTDRATSGAIADRPGLIALREAAKQHAFDVVLVDDLSRLARDNVQMLLLIDDLEYDGIRVVSVADQLDASDEQALLGIQVRGVFNELLLSDLRKKTLRGQLGQKERGYFVGEATPSDRRARAARSGIARRSPDAQPRAVHGRGAQELGHVQRDAAPNGGRNSLNVRLDGPDGSSTVWFLLDPVDSQGWDGPRAAMVTRLLPHLRQFVRVRQAMAAAEGRARTLAALLDNPRIGIIQLDRRRRIVEANDRARSILRHGDGLTDRDGMLRARMPADQGRLERLLSGALPALDSPGASGSMLLRRSSVLRPFVVHVMPVSARLADYEARHVAAVMLIAEPGHRRGIAPELVATTLELTRAESRVAVWLAEGKNVREMAAAAGTSEAAIYWHLKRIYRKHSLSGQADLVRLVLSLPELG